MFMRKSVCVCVYESEKRRIYERVRVCERVFVCVRIRERERECVCDGSVYEREKQCV